MAGVARGGGGTQESRRSQGRRPVGGSVHDRQRRRRRKRARRLRARTPSLRAATPVGVGGARARRGLLASAAPAGAYRPRGGLVRGGDRVRAARRGRAGDRRGATSVSGERGGLAS